MRRRDQGQALTECLAVCAVLVPLLVLIPVIGKLQDVAHASRQASRDAAFAVALQPQTVAAGGAGLADAVRARHFGAAGLAVQAGQRPSDEPADLDPLWTDPLGRPWLRPGAVRVTFGADGSASPADGFVPAGDGLLFGRVPTANAAGLGLSARGLFVAEVAAPVARLSGGVRAWAPLDRLDLAPTSRTALLVDAWTAPSPQAVDDRIEGLAPAATRLHAAAAGIAGLGVPLLELGRLPAPAIGDPSRWRDAVPADRLRPWRQP